MWRLLRRTHVRNRDQTELWNGNVEPGWRESFALLDLAGVQEPRSGTAHVPVALSRASNVHRLRSDADVRAFVQSIQATASTSGSSSVSARQKTPPLTET